MNLHDTALPEVKRITLDIHRDSRGFFCERYAQEKFAALGLHKNFVQDNHSRSLPGVIRGLHFQHTPAQGKLMGVTSGRILDVAVDIRPNSPTYKRHIALELSSDNGELLWIPAGFAHGFCVLGDVPADVVYKLTTPFNAGGETGFRYDDSSIGIDWPIKNPLISERDKAAKSIDEIEHVLRKWFP